MLRLSALLMILLAAGAPARAADSAPSGISADALKYRSGLPVPRFGSLRSGRAYLRVGPGKEYPVSWVLTRPGLPVEILHEWNVWRKVRLVDGTVGWVDRAMLSTDRTLQVRGGTRTLYARPDRTSPPVWRAEAGVIARITMCDGQWCRVEAEGRAGYLPRAEGYGTYPGESIG